ncbi:long-chain-fatty-acid--CoA ligase [Rhodococcus indonesiensis]|uniref:long-chain-fatty-acid--CoA ligase n=1 Tax=Rhodococcus indonesiensis TaxID=3055869 RepID=UPI0039F6CD7B
MYFTQALHRVLQHEPDRIAWIDGEHRATFAEFADRVARLAGGLRSLGIGSGQRVGMLAANRAQFFEYALACPWIGAVASPLNTRWSLDEMAFQIDDAEIGVLFVDAPRLDQALELRRRCATLDTIVAFGAAAMPRDVVDYATLIETSPSVPDARTDPDALAVLMYTGGTTGTPKGVMLSARQMLVSAYGSAVSVGFPNLPGRYLHAAPLFHLAAFGGLVQQMMIGSTHVFIGEFDVPALCAAIERERITTTTLVPTMIPWLLDHAAQRGSDLSSLEYISYGAAPMTRPILDRLFTALPHVRLRQGYGMTELAPVATILRDEDHHDPAHPERLRSVGRAAAHTEIRIVDESDRVVPRGTVGEVVVRGENIMLGYWKNPEATAAAIRAGWMHTGDAGYLDEHGYLFLVDRIKDMIVSGGENVYSAEVEKALLQHPSVSACAVIGVPDEVWGERVHAVVVLEPGTSASADELRDFVGEHIARYKAPRTVDFVAALPLSPVGKILKRVLREELAK